MPSRCALVPLLATFALVAAAAAPNEIHYELGQASRVSLVITDPQGGIVRELLHGAPRAAGPQVELWDGRDHGDRSLPPGSYGWKLLARPQPLRSEYLLTLGNNYPDAPRGSSVPNPDYLRAPGSHGGPTAVAADAEGFYVGASCGEGLENVIVKLSHDGRRRLWSAMNQVAWAGALAMTSHDGKLYVLSTKGDGPCHQMWIFDAAGGALLKRYELGLEGPRGADGQYDNTLDPRDLAVTTGRAALIWPERGMLRWIDPADGRLLGELRNLPRPTAVAIGSDGATYVAVADGRILRTTPDSQPDAWASGLGALTRLVPTGPGELLAFVAGERRQVIRLKAGKEARAYGARGGRAEQCRWDDDAKTSFYDVTGLVALPDGGFIAAEAECAPRRTARFDAEGKCTGEWYGGQVWAPWVAVDPGDHSSVWMPSSWGWVTRYQVDWKRRSWTVRSVHKVYGLADGLINNHDNAHLWTALRLGGATYLCRNTFPCSMLRVEDSTDTLKPVLYLNANSTHDRSWNQKNPVILGLLKGSSVLYWADANGDGTVQAGEVQDFPGGLSTTQFQWSQEGLLTCDNTRGSVVRWPLSLDEQGKPRLGALPGAELLNPLPKRVGSVDGRWGGYLWRDAASGGLLAAFNVGMTDWGRCQDAFVQAWDQEMKPRWQVGGKVTGRPEPRQAPGDIGVFRRIAGQVHGTLVANDFIEGPVPFVSYLWDRGGLWAGTLFEDPDLASAPLWLFGSGGETLGTTILEEQDGSALLLWHGINEVRAARVTGWHGWTRAVGSVRSAGAVDGFAIGLGVWSAWLTTPVAGTAELSVVDDAAAPIVVAGKAGTGKVAVQLPAATAVAVQVRSAAAPRLAGLPAGATLRPRPPQTAVPFGQGTGLTLTAHPEPGKSLSPRPTDAQEDWGNGGPEGVNAWNGPFVTAAGAIVPLHTGLHTFALVNPNRGKLVIGGKRIGDSDPAQRYELTGWNPDHDSVWLEAGKRYAVEFSYEGFTGVGAHGFHLHWATPSGTWPGALTPVPACQLFPDASGCVPARR
ncbi:MAG: hypothetical protein HS113_09230 [Verrucomicrobiales bacterium]|nr:hypothetical protein [Verrucomicrobiales bacterium]